MDTLVQKWFTYAEADLEAAEVLLAHPRSDRSWQMAVLHCHQAVEKLLKAILVQQGKEVNKVHDLARILEETGIALPEEFIEFIDSLNPHYHGMRYPDLPDKGPSFHYDREVAVRSVQQTKALFIWLRKHQFSH